MYHFIVNPNSKSRSAKRFWPLFRAELEQRNTRYRVYFTKYPGHAAEITAKLCRRYLAASSRRAPLVIVVAGGDGTVNEAVNGIPVEYYPQILLGILPIGSGNDLAACLGIPSAPLAALKRILSPGHITPVDHGVLFSPQSGGAKRFCISSGVGYDADICYEVSSSPAKAVLNRLRLGKLVYLAIAIKQIFTHKPVHASLLFDGARREKGSYLCITAMNGAMEGGGLRLAPGARMDDRKLSVCVVHDFPKWKILLLFPTLLLGIHTRIKGIDIVECTSLEILCQKPETVHTDGEFAGKLSHVIYSCTEPQIRVIR